MMTCRLDFGTPNSATAVVRGGEAAMCPCLKRRGIRRVVHIHSSFTMVDVIATAANGREKMAQALQRHRSSPRS
jgi:hypothetical protein